MEHKVTRKGYWKVNGETNHTTVEEAVQHATNKAIELNQVVNIDPPRFEVEVVGIGENTGQNIGENTGTSGLVVVDVPPPSSDGNWSIPAFTIGTGTQYFVSKTGNDTTGNGTELNPYLTIGKALAVAINPGDTVNVESGTYIETDTLDAESGTNPSVAFNASGTASEPITLRAKPGHEGAVNINGEATKMGVHFDHASYCQVYGLRIHNCFTAGIASYTNNINEYSLATVYKGNRIENCLIYDVTGVSTNNCAGIRAYNSDSWVIRNNKIHVFGTNVNCIQSYRETQNIIEHNYLYGITTNVGIYLKDHWLNGGVPLVGSIVRGNRIETNHYGYFLGIRGGGTPASGDQQFYQNIVNGAGTYGINTGLAGAGQASGALIITNNIIYNSTGTGTELFLEGFSDIQIKGNIFGPSSGWMYEILQYQPSTHPTILTACDENIYVQQSGSFAITERYGPNPTVTYSTFAAWQAALAADSLCMGLDNPDANGITSSIASLFNDAANGDFSFAPSSPALAFRLDGSNAGPYQTGNEVIGLLSSYSAGDPI